MSISLMLKTFNRLTLLSVFSFMSVDVFECVYKYVILKVFIFVLQMTGENVLE